MRMKTLYMATGAFAALALSAGAASADPNGWYGAIDLGYHTMNDVRVGANAGTATLPFRPQIYNVEMDDSWAAFGRLGYRFNSNWRAELEGGYRAEQDWGSAFAREGAATLLPQAWCNVTDVAPACTAPEGSLQATTMMANAIYDFGDSDWRVRPFVGLGVGWARVATQVIAEHNDTRGIKVTADDISNDFAAQAIAGVAFALGERTNLDVTYRYFMSEFEFTPNVNSASRDAGTYAGEFDDSHTISVGLRHAFAPPPPPPPVIVRPVTPPPPPVTPPPPRPVTPPPPPQRPSFVPRQFVVYFDWDRSDLTSEASAVVDQAAAYARQGGATRIVIVGHTDTSGSAAYNLGLSNRRARTVADALVARGVNGGMISLDGVGETQLARPTADGVREPLNRRATIDIN